MQFYGISFMLPYKQPGRRQDVLHQAQFLAIIRRCYNNIKNNFEEGASPTILYKTEIIIFIPRNNEIPKHHSMSIGKKRK